MTTYQAFLLGLMVAYTPGLVFFALLLCRPALCLLDSANDRIREQVG